MVFIKKKTKNTIIEPSKEIPVLWEGDVVVAGGGVAGIVAGLASARSGSNTLLIERHECLGGNLTVGIMAWPYGISDGLKVISGELSAEIMENIKRESGLVGDMIRDECVLIDHEIVKYVLNEMAGKESRLKLLLDTWITDAVIDENGIAGVIFENKSGRQSALASITVDTTGDADVVAKTQAEWNIGEKNELYPVSLEGKMVNVDIDRLAKSTKHLPSFPASLRGRSLPGIFVWQPLRGKTGSVPPELEYLTDWFCILGQTARQREIIVNITGAVSVDATNGENITKAEILSRKRLMQMVGLLQKYVPGFESAYLAATAGGVGIRESRRIVGDYVLTSDDVRQATKFEDVVARGSVPLTFHTSNGKDIKKPDDFPLGTAFDIPYRCLLPKGVERLITGGRCISVESKGALGSVRVMGTCMATGQAAGIAAAFSAKTNTSLRKLDILEIQRKLGIRTESESVPDN